MPLTRRRRIGLKRPDVLRRRALAHTRGAKTASKLFDSRGGVELLVTRRQDAPELMEEAATANRHSYGQILKSSALIGLSTMVNLAIGIVRAKAMAVWLGPAGFGLMGLY